MTARKRLEIVCPAGTPAALEAAITAGADAVYVGFRDETNARNFPGLNFDRDEMAEAVRFVHAAGRRLFIAINTYPRAGDEEIWRRAVDRAVELGADAVILADAGLAFWASRRHPQLRLHLSVQASAAHAAAIRLMQESVGIRRVVLPRVLTVAQIASLNRAVDVETEVFAFGGMCVMAEGRCLLSGYVTGRSPNMHGVCSPADAVRFHRHPDGSVTTTLAGMTIDRFPAGTPAAYPTLCKGAFVARGRPLHLFEDPVSLDARPLLPALADAGVTAIKIEGRQRGRAYVARVVRAFREAVDALAAGTPLPAHALGDLHDLSEGAATTAGAYRKEWR